MWPFDDKTALFGGLMMAGEQPDHMSIIAEVARIGEQVRGVVKHLEKQDTVLDTLKTAYNIQTGKSLMMKLIGGTVLGSFGAGAYKIIEWLTHNGGQLPPPMTPGSP